MGICCVSNISPLDKKRNKAHFHLEPSSETFLSGVSVVLHKEAVKATDSVKRISPTIASVKGLRDAFEVTAI